MSSIVIPTPFSKFGLLYVTSGYVGDQVRPVYAIKPGASGDITLPKGETSNASIAWSLPQGGPYNPSPIVYGDYYYTLFDRGFFTCHDARTGKEIYTKVRLDPTASGFTASPWAYNGKIFAMSEDGTTYVIQAGPEFKVIGQNSLDEFTMASPAIHQRQLDHPHRNHRSTESATRNRRKVTQMSLSIRGRLMITGVRALRADGRAALEPAGAGAAAAANVARDPDVLGAQRLFSAWLEGQILYRHLPGIAVGVVADQELIWATGFGFADTGKKVPMTPQTKFRMASHSKLFTATAIMQLREQGKLRLDDPVSKYLPWFQVKAADSDDPPITIEELLTHSSGLPREAGSHWTTFEFPTSEQLRGLMAERQAPFSPEVRWKYSNLAFSIAGMVIETVSGQKWADYVQQHIYKPLGMTSSSVDQNVERARRRLRPADAGRHARRQSRSSMRAAWPRRPASRRRSRTWRSSYRRSSGRAGWAAARS